MKMKKTIGQQARETFSEIEAIDKAIKILKKRHKKEFNGLVKKEFKKLMKLWYKDENEK